MSLFISINFHVQKKAPEQTPEIQNPETEYAEIQNKLKNPEETNSGIFPPVELAPPLSLLDAALGPLQPSV